MVYRLYCTKPALWLGYTITMFVFSTSSIRAGFTSAYYWGISCLLGQTWGYGNCCLGAFALFNLRACGFCSHCPLNISFSLLLSLQFLSNAIALLYHCSIKNSYYSDSISLRHITPFISLLNSFTNSLPSYLLIVIKRFGPNILFFFYLFFFWFYISFSFRTMKKACDKEVTWHITWCDVISLELNGRVWKMMSGHLEYT